MKQAQRILVTSALPYANGPIHLGHLAGAYLPADIYVRYQRLMKREVAFLCGSDEHGVAITITADREKISPQAVVDHYHALNKESFERFGMSFDNYSRTTLPMHHATAQEFFLAMHGQGILKEKVEKQFYDETARMFLPDRYVEGTCPVCKNPEARGDQCERCGSYLNPTDLIDPRSKISGDKPQLRETSHWYFPLGQFQKRLQEYIRQRDAEDGWKANVLNYCEGWFKEGLQDRAVTRDLDWGVRVPLNGYENKVIYVWFDAVLGYISSTREWSDRLGKPDHWKKFWFDQNTKYVAFIGKDNIVFHCIVFPAMLMAWNDGHRDPYVLPENVPANEFLNFEGAKFSKSRGWGIDVLDFLKKYPADPLRYYLGVNLPEYRDSDFTWKDFQARNNNELADILGNFVNRTVQFAIRTFQGKVPPLGPLTQLDEGILGVMAKTPAAAGEKFETYRVREGIMEVMNLARAANKYFNDSEPWKTAAADRARCGTAIHISVQLVRSLAILMHPVVPGSAEKIWKTLNLPGSVADQSWESAGQPGMKAGHSLGTPEILFTKIEDSVIQKELDALPKGEPVPAAVPAAQIPVATIEDFRKLDLRVAKVVACDRVANSEKLLRLQVEVGSERRQIIAGIARQYTAEEMIGKSVVVVFNLQPAKLMGQESQGMLLAASDENGKLVVVAPAADIASGSRVK